MTRPVRKVAFYGLIGSGNFGNDASFETVVHWLRRTHPHVGIECITLTPDVVAARYGVTAVPLRALAGNAPAGRLPRAARVLAGRLLDVPRSLRLAGRADAIVVPGMGVLEERLGSRFWGLPLSMFLVALACRMRGRRFVLLAVGADPVTSPLTRALFHATLRLATHVSYRDALSEKAMRASGRRPDAVVADVAFAHPALERATSLQGSPVVVPGRHDPGRVVLGVMAYYGPHDDPVRGAGVRRGYVAAMREVVAALLEQGDEVVLVGGDRVDEGVAEEILACIAARPLGTADGGGAAQLVRLERFADLLREVSHAEVVVASRYHNLVAAIAAGRPVVSVGYAGKSAELMAAAGLRQHGQELDDLDPALLLRQLARARANGDRLARTAADAADQFATDVAALFGEVAQHELGLSRPGQEAVQ